MMCAHIHQMRVMKYAGSSCTPNRSREAENRAGHQKGVAFMHVVVLCISCGPPRPHSHANRANETYAHKKLLHANVAAGRQQHMHMIHEIQAELQDLKTSRNFQKQMPHKINECGKQLTASYCIVVAQVQLSIPEHDGAGY